MCRVSDKKRYLFSSFLSGLYLASSLLKIKAGQGFQWLRCSRSQLTGFLWEPPLCLLVSDTYLIMSSIYLIFIRQLSYTGIRQLSGIYPMVEITRCDVRIPNHIYEQIEALAVTNGASNHHRSNKPIVTPTILELLQIGLAHYSKPLSDKLPDTNLIDEKISAAIAPIIAELTTIKKL